MKREALRVGVFKGRKAMLAAIYGYPKEAVSGGKKIPGLVQIHGGGTGRLGPVSKSFQSGGSP